MERAAPAAASRHGAACGRGGDAHGAVGPVRGRGARVVARQSVVHRQPARLARLPGGGAGQYEPSRRSAGRGAAGDAGAAWRVAPPEGHRPLLLRRADSDGSADRLLFGWVEPGADPGCAGDGGSDGSPHAGALVRAPAAAVDRDRRGMGADRRVLCHRSPRQSAPTGDTAHRIRIGALARRRADAAGDLDGDAGDDPARAVAWGRHRELYVCVPRDAVRSDFQSGAAALPGALHQRGAQRGACRPGRSWGSAGCCSRW